MSSKPPSATIQSSIRNSALLITRSLPRNKHQMRDFFNSNRISHYVTVGEVQRLLWRHLSFGPISDLLPTPNRVQITAEHPNHNEEDGNNHIHIGPSSSVGEIEECHQTDEKDEAKRNFTAYEFSFSPRDDLLSMLPL